MTRTKDIVFGAVAKVSPQAAAMVKSEPTPPSVRSESPLKYTLLPGVVTGAVGYKMWKKHKYLGALMGLSAGANVYDLVKGDRTRALCRVGGTGVAVGGSLMWKKHPALGFIGGLLAASVAESFIKGSDTYAMLHK